MSFARETKKLTVWFALMNLQARAMWLRALAWARCPASLRAEFVPVRVVALAALRVAAKFEFAKLWMTAWWQRASALWFAQAHFATHTRCRKAL